MVSVLDISLLQIFFASGWGRSHHELDRVHLFRWQLCYTLTHVLYI